MTIAQGIQHGGAHAEETIIAHIIVDLGPIHLSHRVPVDAFHIEKGVVLVHLIPKIFEHVDGIFGLVLLHEGSLTRGERKGQKTQDKEL